MKGVNVTPGYFRNPQKTAEAFDEDGYYRLGDAVKFVDPAQPEKGLAFDGRTVEEFKLVSGTWVSTGSVRVAAVAASGGVLSDAIVCGLNREEIGLLGFLNEAYCQRLAGGALPLEDLVRHPAVEAALREGLAAHNRKNSQRGGPNRPAAPADFPAPGRPRRDHRKGIYQPIPHSGVAGRADRTALFCGCLSG